MSNVETAADRLADMDGAAFRGALEARHAEKFSRLGSPELVAALTGGEMDVASVLEAAAHSEWAARGTFREWAETESDPDARTAFDAVAEQEADHFRRVHERMDGAFEPEDPGPMHAYLRGRTDTLERVAGGMVARPLVSLRTHARLVTFFDERGDAVRADLFRDLRAETAAVVADGLGLLERRCSDADWERVRMVADYVIRLADDDLAVGA